MNAAIDQKQDVTEQLTTDTTTNKVSEDQPTEATVCDLGAFKKPYEDYRMITDTTSPSYQFIQSSLTVQPNGLLTNSDGAVAVALSDRYGGIGTEFNLTLSSGQQLLIVIADIKASQDLTNDCTDQSGAMIEFVVNTDLMDSNVKYQGSYDCIYQGTITKMERR